MPDRPGMFACLRADASVHAALLDCAGAFSPRVEDTAPGTVALDIEGLDRLFGSIEELGLKLLAHLSPLQTEIRVGIASNPDAAVIAARGWAGVTILERGSEAARLAPLDIALLPIEAETHATLRRWGILTFGALAKLPVRELTSRLGRQAVRLHRLARGCAARPLVPRAEPLRFEETMDLDDAVTVLEPLAFILNRLCDVLFLRLRSRGLAALELILTLLRERPHEPFVLPLRLPVPARNPRVVSRLFMSALDAHPPGAGVLGVRLEAIPSKPRVVQNGLFVPLSPEPEKLQLTLARIAALVGRENVGWPRLSDSHARHRFEVGSLGRLGDRPHFVRGGVFRSETFCAHEMGSVPQSPSLPLRVFRPAPEATVKTREGVPVWIGFSGVHGDIATASGPWLGSGDWWGSRHWAREEWDVAVSGSLLRIYRENRWYAEGIYD